MRLAVPLAVLTLCAASAGAQEVAPAVLDALAEAGCVLTLAEGAGGLPPAALEAEAERMVGQGLGLRLADGRLLASPYACAAADGGIAQAAAWIEATLPAHGECRLPLAFLAEDLAYAGFMPEAIDGAVIDLGTRGVIVPRGAEVELAACATPMPPPMDDLERVEAYGEPGYRGAVALFVLRNGCRIRGDGREAAVAAIGATVAEGMGLAPTPEVEAALRSRIEEVLDNPGRSYEIEPGTGDLVMVPCSP